MSIRQHKLGKSGKDMTEQVGLEQVYPMHRSGGGGCAQLLG